MGDRCNTVVVLNTKFRYRWCLQVMYKRDADDDNDHHGTAQQRARARRSFSSVGNLFLCRFEVSVAVLRPDGRMNLTKIPI